MGGLSAAGARVRLGGSVCFGLGCVCFEGFILFVLYFFFFCCSSSSSAASAVSAATIGYSMAPQCDHRSDNSGNEMAGWLFRLHVCCSCIRFHVFVCMCADHAFVFLCVQSCGVEPWMEVGGKLKNVSSAESIRWRWWLSSQYHQQQCGNSSTTRTLMATSSTIMEYRFVCYVQHYHGVSVPCSQ